MPDRSELISIILPVYNGERTLKETLDSLVNQSHEHFELIIGIDGTKDGSKSIAESFRDPRFKIIEHETNLGLGPNLNALIKCIHPESQFIAMAEQDDIYVPERLTWQLEAMRSHPEAGLVSGIAEFMSDHNSILFPGILLRGEQFPQGEELFRYLYINQLKVVNTCMLVRRSVHESNQLQFTNSFGNHNIDWDYVLRFSLVSKVHGLPKKLVTMNRKQSYNSVTTNKVRQHEMARKLLLDFKTEFPKLIDRQTYHAALKMHRKIELGHHSRLGIIIYGLSYALWYMDTYFLKYITNKAINYLKQT